MSYLNVLSTRWTLQDLANLNISSSMTYGAPLAVEQSFEWNITITYSVTSMNYGILLQGFGGIFAIPLIESIGL